MPASAFIQADAYDEGIRLDTLLGEDPRMPSRSAAVKLIESGKVTVNGLPSSKKYLVAEGDRIEFELPEPQDAGPTLLVGEYIPLDIRYEDEYLIVLSKQADLVCHPSVGHETGTLANALVAHCGSGSLGTLQGEDRPGIVHRLDKDTTGLMLAAKDDATQAALQDMIRLRSIDRRYLALVQGYIAPDTAQIDAPIARSSHDRLKMEVSGREGARSSVTTFKVLERFEAGRSDEGYTLLECKLYTGRTHQIRVHMAYIKHPCVGDLLYGAAKQKYDCGLVRQFLHSYHLDFTHPSTGEHLEFADALPEDLQEVLDSLGERSMGRTDAGAQILDGLHR